MMSMLLYRCLFHWPGTAGDQNIQVSLDINTFLYTQRYCRENNEPKVLQAETVLTSQLREAATKTRIEFKQALQKTRNDFVNGKMNDMMGDLKKKLMNDDMWEAFDTIVYLVGKFVEYFCISFFYNIFKNFLLI